MFVRHVHQCKMQLYACGAVHVAGMLLGQRCFERQVEICLDEVVSYVCAGLALFCIRVMSSSWLLFSS